MNEIKEYDKNGNEIYTKYYNNIEYWREYDKNNNLIHFKDSNNFESWREYDEKNREIYFKDFNGNESWYKFDENNKSISITEQEFKQIEKQELYFNNKRINRFELMDI